MLDNDTFTNAFDNAFNDFRKLSDDFDLYRNNEYISTIKGFLCSNDYPNSIQTVDRTQIKENDVLIHKITNEKYTAYSLRPLTTCGKLNGYIIEYKPKDEDKNIYNIQSITGNSAIGTNSTFNLINQSTEDLLRLIDQELQFSEEKTELLTALIELKSQNKSIDKSKFNKFSDLLKKHENLLIPLGTFIAKILFSTN